MDSYITFFALITLAQLHWIAIWGITDMGVQFFAGNSSLTRLVIYLTTVIFAFLFLYYNPKFRERY